jgi:hypothetical protein
MRPGTGPQPSAKFLKETDQRPLIAIAVALVGWGHWNRKPQRPPLPTWPSAANLPILRKEKKMQVEIEYCGM